MGQKAGTVRGPVGDETPNQVRWSAQGGHAPQFFRGHPRHALF
jgi:hypothetical protein